MHPTSSARRDEMLRPGQRASPRWEVLRVALAGTYLLGGLAHVALGLFAPEIYPAFANQALVGVYTELWVAVVVPSLWVLHPLVAGFEVGLAVALCWRGRAVLAGHALGASFQIALILSGPWGPINAVLAVLHTAALRRPYPLSVVDFGRRLRRGPHR